MRTGYLNFSGKAMVLLALMLTAACAPLDPAQQKFGNEVKVERVSNNAFEIVSADLYRDGNDVVVVGKVKPGFNFPYFPTAWTHVDVVACDHNGNVIKGVATRIFAVGSGPGPRPSPAWTWPFSAKLSNVPPNISSVRVIARYGLLKEDPLVEPVSK